MKTKIALSLIALAFVSACAGVPTFDERSFPADVVYGAAGSQPAAGLVKDAASK